MKWNSFKTEARKKAKEIQQQSSFKMEPIAMHGGPQQYSFPT